MIDRNLESLTMRLVRCQNYAEPRTSAISQSKDAHSRHKINVGVILGLKTGQSHQPASESFPLSHSSALFSSSSPFPSLSCYVLSFSNVFCCCDTQRCLLTNQNILGGTKIQHFQAMQTSVDLAKTQMIKKKKKILSPTKTSMNAFFWFHSPSLCFIPPSRPTFCPHLLLFPCRSLSLMTVLSSLSHLSLSA